MRCRNSSSSARPRWTASSRHAREHPGSRLLGGGTDLVVNIRRGIVAPTSLIDVNRRRGAARDHGRRASDRDRRRGHARRACRPPAGGRHYPVVAQAAACIAGPTHRNMGTVGGNLCLDTRCLFYNQSEWWRSANNHCLKTTGDICHVAPKSRGVCFATFSGDLAPAFLTLSAEVDLAGPGGDAHVPLEHSISAMRGRISRSPRRSATAIFICRCGRANSSRRCGQRTRPGCARPMTRSASAARSNIP